MDDSGLIKWNIRANKISKQGENLTVFGVAPRLCLGIERLAVDLNVKDSLAPGDQRQISNHMLIVGQ